MKQPLTQPSFPIKTSNCLKSLSGCQTTCLMVRIFKGMPRASTSWVGHRKINATQQIHIVHCHRCMSPFLLIGWGQSTRWISIDTDVCLSIFSPNVTDVEICALCRTWAVFSHTAGSGYISVSLSVHWNMSNYWVDCPEVCNTCSGPHFKINCDDLLTCNLTQQSGHDSQFVLYFVLSPYICIIKDIPISLSCFV